MDDFCAAAADALRAFAPSLVLELDRAFETVKPFSALDDKEKKAFCTRFAKSVNDGLALPSRKDSLFAYLSLSVRGREKFSGVTKIAVEMSPPGKLKTSSQDVHVLWDNVSTLTLVVNQKSIADGKPLEGFGPAIDLAMGLCCLSDVYIDKAKLSIAQTMASAAQMCPPLVFEPDWTFVDHANYLKLAEDARASAVTAYANMVKTGMLDKKEGLASHLQRSARATAEYARQIQLFILTIDPDNRCKAPIELGDGGVGALRVSVRLNALDKGVMGWGPFVDERLGLRVVDEEGMRAAGVACAQHVQHLPLGTRLEVDWSFMLNDKWRKMKPEDRAANLASICKKTLMTGVQDKRDGLVGLFTKSPRARQIFTEKVGAVQLRIEYGGSPKPMLIDGGVLSLPCLLASLDENQPWGSLTEAALNLRVQDELELRKFEAAIEKTGCGGLPVVVDWSFLDDPVLQRATAEKRMGIAKTMVDFVQAGCGGKQGLGSLGADLNANIDKVYVRTSSLVKAKSGVEMRFGNDRVLEVMVKTQAITGSNGPEMNSWREQYLTLKNDGGTAVEFPIPYSLLAVADASTVCQVTATPPAANPLLEADAAGGVAPSPYHSAPSSLAPVATASAPPASAVGSTAKAAAPPAVKAASPPPARAVAPAPAKAAAPAPVAVAVVAPKPAAVVAAAPAPSADGVPAELGCPAAWKAVVEAMTTINRSCQSQAVAEVDWSFMQAGQFTNKPDTEKKQVVSNLGVRMFAPLEKELTKLVKRHALYHDVLGKLQRVQFRYDVNETIMDMASGKSGKTHYSVVVLDGGAVMQIACNLSQHMAGIIPVLEGKLQVAYGVHHVVLLQETEKLISVRGEKSKITCFLDSNHFASHDAFLKQPVNTDSIAWWMQVCKEADAGLGKLITAIELASKDPIFAAAFKARFSSILVQPDPTSSVRDPAAPLTWTLIDNAEQSQVVFRYNINDGAQAGQAAAGKLATFVDVRLAQAVEAARKDAAEQLMKFRPSVVGTELELIDFFEPLSGFKLDKSIDICKSLKVWLGGMTRQLGMIVQRNPQVFKAKVQMIRFGLDPNNGSKKGVDTVVTYEGGVLSIIQNAESATKPDPTVSQRVDNLLDVTMVNLQGEVTAEMVTRSQTISNALRTPGIVVNLDFSFESVPAFATLAPQAKQAKVKRLRGHVESVLDSLIKCGPDHAKNIIAVMVGVDGSNSVDDPLVGATDAEHYSCELTPDGLLRVIINLDGIEKAVGRIHHKVEQQCALHNARHDKTYHDGIEWFDWETLQQCPRLLNDTILSHFEGCISHIQDAVRMFARCIHTSSTGSPAGKQSINTLEKRSVRMNRDQREPWVIFLEDGEKTLVLSVSLDWVRDKHSLEEVNWKEAIEWVLRSTVEVEKFHAENRARVAEKKLKDAFGVSLAIAFDWAEYVDRPQFLELTASGVRNAIRRMSNQLLNKIVDGFLEIAPHPIGKKAVAGRVKTIRIKHGPAVDQTQRLIQPAKLVVQDNGDVLITLRHLLSACEMDYKTRIEFEMGIIVDVAEYDALQRRDQVSKSLGGLPITYDLKGFQHTDEFRYGLDIETQPRIVDAVVAGIAEHVWGGMRDSLLSVWDRAQKVVKSVRIEVSVNNTLNGEHGKLELRGDVLVLTMDLGLLLHFRDSINWRPRIASVCGFLDALSQDEANAKLALINKALGLAPVSIDWSFMQAPQWKALPAAERYERAHNLGSDLAREVLMGYWGLPGLTFFPRLREEFLKRVKAVHLVVDAAQAKGSYRSELVGTTLRLVFSLDETRAWPSINSYACRERIEKTMDLRKLMEEEAVSEQESKHVTAATAGCPGKRIIVNWAKMLASADYLAVRDYVAYIRHVGDFICPLLLGYGDKPQGLPAIVATNDQFVEFYKLITTIEVEIDGECTVRPPQDRFVNPNMNCVKKSANTLLLTVRRDWRDTSAREAGCTSPHHLSTHYGCGAVVEWLLAPGVCAAKEAEHLATYKSQLIANEENRRQDAVADWQYHCNRRIEEYNDEMQRYARAATENCYSCNGKCFSGSSRCYSCKGTGRRQASMSCPEMPINPPQPTFVALSTINFVEIAKVETKFQVQPKVAFSTLDHSVPKVPAFTDLPCPHWSKDKVNSLGAEDKRPEGQARNALKGWTAYPPAPVQEDPMGCGDGIHAELDGKVYASNKPSKGNTDKSLQNQLTSAMLKRGK